MKLTNAKFGLQFTSKDLYYRPALGKYTFSSDRNKTQSYTLLTSPCGQVAHGGHGGPQQAHRVGAELAALLESAVRAGGAAVQTQHELQVLVLVQPQVLVVLLGRTRGHPAFRGHRDVSGDRGAH